MGADSITGEPPKQIQGPSMDLAAFVCPHCGAFTQQLWLQVFAQSQEVGNAPQRPTPEYFAEAMETVESEEARQRLARYAQKRLSHMPEHENLGAGRYVSTLMANLHLSRCFICLGTAIWLRDRMIWPTQVLEIEPNQDLPEHIKADFREAAAIADASPRGAAALLRLAIEKLCLHLGKTGSIDAMIAQLVAEGLSVRVKQALDVVRVTGKW